MGYTSFHLPHQLQKELSDDDQSMISTTSQEHKHSTTQSWIPSYIYNGYSNGWFLTNSRELEHRYDMVDSLRVSTRQQDYGFYNEQNLSQEPVNDILPLKAVNESQEPLCSPRLSFFYNPSITETEYLPMENLFNAESQKPIEGGMTLNMRHNIGNTASLVSSMGSEVTATKRHINWSPSKKSEAKAKKSRPSCPPPKVRKEKVGDRIQTLQRLVAPFGKTSTVCVLGEAIGYIHLLHEQIQTLSIHYMESVQSKNPRMWLQESRKVDSRELKAGLRSRGLCLVPVSYASF